MTEEELREHTEALQRYNTMILMQQSMGAAYVGILPNYSSTYWSGW